MYASGRVWIVYMRQCIWAQTEHARLPMFGSFCPPNAITRATVMIF